MFFAKVGLRACHLFVFLLLFSFLQIGLSASATFAVRLPEILILYVNRIQVNELSVQLPVQIDAGKVVPDSIEVWVVANVSWILWAQASEFEGPLVLPPESLCMGEQCLSALPKPLMKGRGVFRKRYPLIVKARPEELQGVYSGVITLNVTRLP